MHIELRPLYKVFKLIASLPTEGSPPLNIKKMIEQCISLGRQDLASQIQMQWAKILHKYPKSRLNWAAATKAGGISIKKNVFDGKEYVVWLDPKKDLPPDEVAVAKAIPTVLPTPKSVPAIAVPTDRETAEDWQDAAHSTKLRIDSVLKAFKDTSDYIKYLDEEITDIKRNVNEEVKSIIQSGRPVELAKKVPIWESMLQEYENKIVDNKNFIKENEKRFTDAIDRYNTAPITTVEFEKKSQDYLMNVQDYVLDMDSIEKQEILLKSFKNSFDDFVRNQAFAESVDAVKEFSKNTDKTFESIKKGWGKVTKWKNEFIGSIEELDELVSIDYDYAL